MSLRYFRKVTILLTTLCVMVTVVAYTVPAIPKAEAGGGPGGQATEGTQRQVRAEARVSAVQNTLSAAANQTVAALTADMFAKENVLDGIAWNIAKQMVSQMTRSLINWVNSGFEGSPSFVTDLNQMLLDAVDTAAGEYIRSLGGLGEFICSPFRLDVQAALAINYQQSRSGMPSGGDENLCKLTDIGANIESFLAGTVDSWDQWLQVTSNPQNTPYGAYLEAQAQLNARLVNAAGQELTIANWGEGFLSKKECTPVDGGGERCRIVTPGEVISEALTFQLSTGPQALIEADEINELIGALLNQLALKAVEGINGLLGLSEAGNGGVDLSYLDQIAEEEADMMIDISFYYDEMVEARDRELEFLSYIATTTRTLNNTINATSGVTGSQRDAARRLRSEVSTVADQVQTNLARLNALITRYESAGTSTATSSASSTLVRRDVLVDYLKIRNQDLFNDGEINAFKVEWNRVIDPFGESDINAGDETDLDTGLERIQDSLAAERTFIAAASSTLSDITGQLNTGNLTTAQSQQLRALQSTIEAAVASSTEYRNTFNRMVRNWENAREYGQTFSIPASPTEARWFILSQYNDAIEDAEFTSSPNDKITRWNNRVAEIVGS